MNLIEKFAFAIKKEPEKSFIQKGITNMGGTLTPEGQQLFNAFLIGKFGDEFKKNVVDLIEDDKK